MNSLLVTIVALAGTLSGLLATVTSALGPTSARGIAIAGVALLAIERVASALENKGTGTTAAPKKVGS